MITLFSPMRPFVGDIEIVQKQAINNWLRMSPSCEIFLIDDEESTTAEKTDGMDVKIIDVKRSISGVPLLDSMFEEVLKIAKYDVICYITADILLPKNFTHEIVNFDKLSSHKFGDYVGIGCRYDLLDDSISKIDLNDDEYYDLCLKNSVKRKRSGIDLWVINRKINVKYLPFPIGRCLTDNWFVAYCKYNNIKVVDFSDQIKMVHQNHTKPAKQSEYFLTEKIICHVLFKDASKKAMDIFDADYIYMNSKFSIPSGLRFIYSKLSKFLPYRFLLSIRRKHKNKLFYVS